MANNNKTQDILMNNPFLGLLALIEAKGKITEAVAPMPVLFGAAEMRR